MGKQKEKKQKDLAPVRFDLRPQKIVDYAAPIFLRESLD